MSSPFTIVTVTGFWGVGVMGTVTFQLSVEMQNPNGTPTLVPTTPRATNLANGAIAIGLEAVDDAGTTPSGANAAVWNVLEQLPNTPPVRYAVSILAAMAPTVDLAALTRLPPSLPYFGAN